MTAETLNGYTMKDLAQMAKKRGVPGWHAMKKDQLVKALVRAAGRKSAATGTSARAASSRTGTASRNNTAGTRKATPAARASSTRTTASTRNGTTRGAAAKSSTRETAPASRRADQVAPAAIRRKPARVVEAVAKPKNKHAARRLQQIRSQLDLLKNLATSVPGKPTGKDRLVVMVRDPFWLHAYWELTRQGVERAQAALAEEWHGARPVLRLMEVSSGGTTSSTETMVRDIEVHGGVNNWYIDVKNPPRSYRVDIGYLSTGGKFYVLARSNVVSTPKAGSSDSLDENWTDVAENFEKIYAMSGGYAPEGANVELQELFEERLRRPMGSPMVTRFGPGAEGLVPKKREFKFELDAELIVFGATEPNAHVTLQGDPIKLRPDGTFTVRFSMPNCRQVIPAVASSIDGCEQRTIVLAVERNTKAMEPLIRDAND